MAYEIYVNGKLHSSTAHNSQHSITASSKNTMAKYFVILTDAMHASYTSRNGSPDFEHYYPKSSITVRYSLLPNKKYVGYAKDTHMREYSTLKDALKYAYSKARSYSIIGEVAEVKIYMGTSEKKKLMGIVRYDRQMRFSPITGADCRFGVLWIPAGLKIGEPAYPLNSTGNIEDRYISTNFYINRAYSFPSPPKKNVDYYVYKNRGTSTLDI